MARQSIAALGTPPVCRFFLPMAKWKDIRPLAFGTPSESERQFYRAILSPD
jgi:hypothetical protein